MNVADVFVITNDVTNRCNPLYEAICASLPVVSVWDSSTSDLLESEVNALLADKEDVQTLGKHLANVCGNKDLHQAMKRAQHSRAATIWTWEERMAAEVRELEGLVKHSEATPAH